jgi:hypothetical protein
MVDFGITVCTIDWFYQYGSKDDIIIIDEYDSIIQSGPYMVFDKEINGVWEFKGRKVFAFTATSSVAFERFVHNCIAPPAILRFSSEYEIKNKISPI